MHADRGWVEGVGGREEKGAPVLPVHVRCVGGSGQDVVPFQDVGFGWVGGYVGRWVGLDGGIFAGELKENQCRLLGGLWNGGRTLLFAALVAIAGEPG